MWYYELGLSACSPLRFGYPVHEYIYRCALLLEGKRLESIRPCISNDQSRNWRDQSCARLLCSCSCSCFTSSAQALTSRASSSCGGDYRCGGSCSRGQDSFVPAKLPATASRASRSASSALISPMTIQASAHFVWGNEAWHHSSFANAYGVNRSRRQVRRVDGAIAGSPSVISCTVHVKGGAEGCSPRDSAGKGIFQLHSARS
jgi:hypothetical protein